MVGSWTRRRRWLARRQSGRANSSRGGQLFGDDVARAFPSSKGDIDEAGKCLALDRGTACVFHLMRILEIGLQLLAAKLGISLQWTVTGRRF